MRVTLSQARLDLAQRLGFVLEGQAAVRQRGILDNFIRDAQDFVYWQTADDRYSKTAFKTLGLGQSFLDLPDDAETLKPFRLWWRREDLQDWKPLGRDKLFGADIEEADMMQHTPFMRASSRHTPSGQPCAYRILFGQVEVAPASETDALQIRFDYWVKLPRLTHDADEILMEYSLVRRLALLNAKAHYQQSDAEVIKMQYAQVLSSIRSGAHVDRRYKARGYH